MSSSLRRSTLCVCATLIVLALVASPFSADVLYGAAHTGGPSAPSFLYTINPSNGTATNVGAIGFDSVGGIDFQPVTGILYGVGKRQVDGVSALFTIDTQTGLGSEVGPLVNVVTPSAGGLFDISFRHSDGALFMSALADPNVALWSINLQTGEATFVGDTGYSGAGNGMAFSLVDDLRFVSSGDVARLDVDTGAGTQAATVSYTNFPTLNNPRITALEFRPVVGGSWVAVNDGMGGGGPNYLAFINTYSGVVNHVGQTVNGIDALAWQRSPLVQPLGRVYGTAAPGGPTTPSTLYELDPTTGSSVSIGPIGFNAVGGIDFDPDTRQLYGVGKRPQDDTNVLIRIDTGTGVGSEVGPLVNVATPGFGGLFDLSWREDGTLFLAAIWPNDNVGLYTVDPATGVAVAVGDTTVGGSGNGIGFSVDDVLVLSSDTDLYAVNTTTGEATLSGAFSFIKFPSLSSPSMTAMDFNPISGAPLIVVNDGSMGSGPNYIGYFDRLSGNIVSLGPTVNGLTSIAWRPSRDDCDITIFGTAQTGNASSPSFFYEIDPDTGVATSVGSVGFNGVGGMALEPQTRTLYAVARRPQDNVNVLITIDPATGRGSEVGPLVNTGNFGGGHFDLTFRRSDGTLFLLANDSTPSKSLFTINKSTGLATFVGITTTDATGNALAYSIGEVLYHGDTTDGGSLRTIDPATGASSAFVALTYTGFPPLSNTRTNAMDVLPTTGDFFVAVNDGSFGNGPNYLATMDPISGVVSHVGRSVNGLGSIAVIGGCDDTVDCTIDSCEGCQGLLYGTVFAGGGNSQLRLIDPSSGLSEFIGDLGFPIVSVSGIDFHPTTGILYGAGKRRTDLVDVLITIDPTTGFGVEVGPFINTDALGGIGHFDISIRNADGVLMLTAYDSMGSPTLFTVDLGTGLATPVGAIGSTGTDAGTGFSSTDQLVHADNDSGGTLFDIDTMSGAGSIIASLNYSGFPMLVDPRPTAIDFDPCASTATIVIDDGVNGSGPNYLGTLDTATGTILYESTTINGLNGLAWRPVAGRICTNTLTVDDDGDGLCSAQDNCPQIANAGQGDVLFPEMVVATDSDTFSWTTPLDVARLSGTITDLPSYAFGGLTTEAATNSFTVGDPLAGETRYFLVRVDCEAGSWSGGGAGECPAAASCPVGARDGNLP